jgi:(1->4)-alpha-D-glucan 1-alpha-D-glucosylmutase
MAKGVEDTAFFRFNRLLALNEVGCDPDAFGTTPAAAHEAFARQSTEWPDAMLATTTHDTKRSEDARARLAVLTEFPRVWRAEVRAWARMNAHWRLSERGRETPDRNTEYYLYQTLVACWEGATSPRWRERVARHLTKAMREAKIATGWASINEEYERDVHAFLRSILDRRKSGRFLERLAAFVDRLTPAATVNGFALLTLKCCVPGIPDFYQGAEAPLRTLTDPDNREPVDFKGLAATLVRASASEGPPADYATAKPWLAQRLLTIRREHRLTFSRGAYSPVRVDGPRADNLFAFLRGGQARSVLVVVPRLAGSFIEPPGRFQSGALNGTWLRPPAPSRWHDLLTGRVLDVDDGLDAAGLLEALPVAILLRDDIPCD